MMVSQSHFIHGTYAPRPPRITFAASAPMCSPRPAESRCLASPRPHHHRTGPAGRHWRRHRLRLRHWRQRDRRLRLVRSVSVTRPATGARASAAVAAVRHAWEHPQQRRRVIHRTAHRQFCFRWRVAPPGLDLFPTRPGTPAVPVPVSLSTSGATHRRPARNVGVQHARRQRRGRRVVVARRQSGRHGFRRRDRTACRRPPRRREETRATRAPRAFGSEDTAVVQHRSRNDRHGWRECSLTLRGESAFLSH